MDYRIIRRGHLKHVGTGSARAGLISSKGKVVNICVKDIKTWNPQTDFYQQSSEDIWNACAYCIQEVTRNIEKTAIKGIGFDATCSLVVLDKKGQPLTVSPTGDNSQNIILWMDHRASREAAKINQLNHSVLKYVGGKISLEMETPKLLWLKNNLYEKCWNKAGYFFDLPDFLTWKATGYDFRSLCSLVCKWSYEIDGKDKHGWSESYLKEIGLEDLIEDNFKKIGSKVLSPGTPTGQGLNKEAASVLGLLPGTPVGTSMIDAHAGGLGLIGCSIEGVPNVFGTKLSLICGTSTCHMAVSKEPIFTEGVWGPYFSAMVPGMWLNEGGQSATGKLVDHIIETHPAMSNIKEKIGEKHVQTYLAELLKNIAEKRKVNFISLLTKDLHVWPDFHGNRSPLADPGLKGMICGLTLAADEENLALLYLATLQALAYGTKHIIETLIKYGYDDIKSILICGGLSKNELFIQTQADVVNIPVIVPNEKESVILGAGILGACAAGYFKDMETAIKSMGGSGKVVYPDQHVQTYHERKYRVFLKMVEDQHEYRKIMNFETSFSQSESVSSSPDRVPRRTMTMYFSFLVYFLVQSSYSAVIKTRSGPLGSYDQKQTGEYNIRLHLKDFQIIALLSDEALSSLSDDYEDIDYHIPDEYLDIQFTTTPNSTSTTSSSSTPPLTNERPSPTTTSTTSTTLPPRRTVTSRVTTRKPEINTKTTLSTTTAKISATTSISSATKGGKIDEVSAASLKKPIVTSVKEDFDKIPVIIMQEKSNKNSNNITNKIISTSVTIVPSSEATGGVGSVSQVMLGEILHYKKCPNGYSRDKMGRCRKTRRPQLPFDVSRFTSSLATRFKRPSTTEKFEN
ncbi:hypothetical protein Trydic_g10491 [Trypoxylus dichotomus]